jgi:hypothetical protein
LLQCFAKEGESLISQLGFNRILCDKPQFERTVSGFSNELFSIYEWSNEKSRFRQEGQHEHEYWAQLSFVSFRFQPEPQDATARVLETSMTVKKSELYSSLWASCDELRGGMDASQYKDYVLFMLFIKICLRQIWRLRRLRPARRHPEGRQLHGHGRAQGRQRHRQQDQQLPVLRSI